MKLLLPTTCAAILALGLAGAAQAAPDQNTNDQNANSQQANPATNTNTPGFRQQFAKDLESAGFTDVKIMPESFLVRAKDKRGRPVMMVINPDSLTEVVGNPAHSSQANNNDTNNESSSSSSQPDQGSSK